MSKAKEKESQMIEENATLQKLPYPKSVFFIISTEFCERFSFYGMKTVLSLFFTQILGFTTSKATILYSTFNAICYFTPMFGAALADSFVGKFRTIFYISLVYALGQVTLTIAAIGDDEDGNDGLHGLPAEALAYIGLFLIAAGTGGIKPCVASFGGEQFKLPEQADQMGSFFSMFYASINGGSLVSTALTPILRQNVACFGQDSCYPLAFGVPAVLMCTAILLFGMGKLFGMYRIVTPDENIIVKTTQCIWYCTKQKFSSSEKKDSFLDYGIPKYGKNFTDDVKALGRVAYIFLPFIVFWCLYDQQGSTWVFQMTRMNGLTFGYVILPDMMQVANPLLILAFIPIFDYGIYPVLNKCKLLTTPLQRMGAGFFLGGLSFTISGILELQLEKTYPDLPTEGNMHFTVYNGFNCPIPHNISLYQKNENNEPINLVMLDFTNNSTEFVEFNNMPTGQYYIGPIQELECLGEKFKPTNEYKFAKVSPPEKDPEKTYEDDAQHVLITKNLANHLQNEIKIQESIFRERLEKSETGLPIVKVFWNLNFDPSKGDVEMSFDAVDLDDDGKIEESENEFTVITNETTSDAPFEILLNVGDMAFNIKQSNVSEELVEQTLIKDINFSSGGNYQILVQNEDSNFKKVLRPWIAHEITEPNQIHIFWLLPQFVVMTLGEIMFSIQSLEFSFTQAPESMKAVMMAVRMLTNAFGNVLTIIVSATLESVFEHRWQFIFLFTGLMFLDAILFTWMATTYTYVDYTTMVRKDEDEEEDDDEKKEKSEKE